MLDTYIEMRVPIRKAGKQTSIKPDSYLTPNKLKELRVKLERLKKNLPQALSEVKRLGEMGDFSENAAYGMAKARLRGMNQRILELEYQLKHAQVIETKKGSATVQLGSQVTVEINGEQKVWRLLGSVEADPSSGVVSHLSPIGQALLGHKVGEEVVYKSSLKMIKCRITKIA